jgi:hypothetical protein
VVVRSARIWHKWVRGVGIERLEPSCLQLQLGLCPFSYAAALCSASVFMQDSSQSCFSARDHRHRSLLG